MARKTAKKQAEAPKVDIGAEISRPCGSWKSSRASLWTIWWSV